MSGNLANGDSVLIVEGLCKKFCKHLRRSMYYGAVDIFRNMAGFPAAPGKLRKHEFWALEDIGFELKKGDSLGIIGANGSGKSTLLRVLTGVFPPDKGKVAFRGKIGSLIAVGAGFHPHMTGRENVFLNGTILGMSKYEINDKFDEIVEFSEIGDFLDAPVSAYSSGMKVRLGFSIAVKIRPEILLIDEVLSVGDQKFRRKARLEMDKLLGSGVTIIFVSHNMHEILGVSRETIWLDEGRIKMAGESNKIVSEYLKECDDETGGAHDFRYNMKRTGDIQVTGASCVYDGTDSGREVRSTLRKAGGDYFTLNIMLKAKENINEKLFYTFKLMTAQDLFVGYTGFQELRKLKAGESYSLKFKIDIDSLHAGGYVLSFDVATDGGPPLESIFNLIYINIKNEYSLNNDKGLCMYRLVNNASGGYFLPIDWQN